MRILGLDGGIASIGWAVIEVDHSAAAILAAGVRTFDAPETGQERKPTNALRRMHRGQRRVIRRRRQRMARLRQLFFDHGLLASTARDVLKQPGLDPWVQRAESLDRFLTPLELAVALGHIARHRGFRSNSKRERGANAPDDASKMLKAIATTRERLSKYATVGIMFARDSEFAGRRRNRDGDYSRSVLRADLEAEAHSIFAAQRRLGNGLASNELELAFADIAYSQRPLQDSEHLVAQCTFEPTEMRTARRSYAFEMFRLLSRLANLRLIIGAQEQRLDAEQIGRIADDFGSQKKITYKSVRRLLDLTPRTRFEGVAPDDEGRDVVARSGNAAEGTATLRNVVGEAAWRALLAAPATLDRTAEIITFRDDLGSIRAGLEQIGLEQPIIEAIMAGVQAGRFSKFAGTGHISAKAARVLLLPMRRGVGYYEACEEVGYDHSARPATDIRDVRNPVARKALGEMLKQVRAIVREYGLPDLMHVELARDVGKSAEERDKITRGIEDRNKEKDRRRVEFVELLHREPGDEDLLRYELWKEQNGRCLYSDELIPLHAIIAADNSIQVDHILPWSRFGDDSFLNKTLCTARANQAKRGGTPFEWFQADKSAADWEAFEARVEGCKSMKGRKKRGHYLRRNAAEVEQRFKARNLGDTRFATRLLLSMLARLYPADGSRHVLARPGALTAKLRRAWGLEDIKKTESGKRREDDRHHALDAIVVAATSEAMLQSLTRAFQEAERTGQPREFTAVPEPWSGFREAARAAVARAFVSRAERHRARGEAHNATIRQVRRVNGVDIAFERKPVEKLTLADLERIPVPTPYGRAAEPRKMRDAMILALRRWIEAAKPKDAPPLSLKGDVIRKVRVASKDKVAIRVRDGSAGRGEMARVDVFARKDGRGRQEFFLVPIYPHQVADRRSFPAPPSQAVDAHKPEVDWTVIDENFLFLFSLYPNSLVEIRKTDGEVIRGYFKGLDRNGGQIAIAMPESQQNVRGGIGSRTLQDFRKFSINRLGVVSEIKRETRTWHGEACT